MTAERDPMTLNESSVPALWVEERSDEAPRAGRACPRFVDRAPAEVVATLLDEGQYLCSARTMYRILAANQPVRERRNQRDHPQYTKPELVATGPNQTWSWDITKLLGPKTRSAPSVRRTPLGARICSPSPSPRGYLWASTAIIAPSTARRSATGSAA